MKRQKKQEQKGHQLPVPAGMNYPQQLMPSPDLGNGIGQLLGQPTEQD